MRTIGFQKWWLLSLIVAYTVSGCGRNPEKDGLDVARQLVETGLAAWKAKSSPESLQSRTPRLGFTDQDWKAGIALVDYQITQSEIGSDQLVRWHVKLTLNKQGKRVEREVCYIVDVNRSIITRDPYS